MKYEDIPPMDKDQAERIFRQSSSADIVPALFAVALHSPDWRWVQDHCLAFLPSQDLELQTAAISCLGHVARIHGTIDREKVIPALLRLSQSKPELAGRIEDALDDIQMFAIEHEGALASPPIR